MFHVVPSAPFMFTDFLHLDTQFCTFNNLQYTYGIEGPRWEDLALKIVFGFVLNIAVGKKAAFLTQPRVWPGLANIGK